jgi:hypothetical protein
MYEFTPLTHNVDICVECGIKIPEDDPENTVSIILEGEERVVPGLLRCTSCAAFVELGTARSAVDLKAAHAWLMQRLIPKFMLRVMELEMEVRALSLTGPSAGRIVTAFEVLRFLIDSDELMDLAAGLADDLGQHLSIETTQEMMQEYMQALIRESHPVYTEAELDGFIERLDLRREPNGDVTCVCTNPDCPADNRHPLSFVEAVFSDQIVEALVGRLPE